ncbi:MAG: trypsin-like peptidase domain-containing protein [Treponemataceae bacterium]|nr:trypsin-like peptidase domain-containing protein [Treponemataceae bacterium]
MKLYSRFQVILIASITALAVIVLCSVCLFINYYRVNSAETVVEQTAHEDEQVPVLNDTPVFEFKTSQVSPVLKETLDGYTQEEVQNITVYETCKDAVVNITTEVVAVNWFLEPVPQEGSSGSGAIIDKRGYVVTNTHVIADAYRIYIALSDGTQYEGTVVGSDSASDIAVVKFTPPENLELRTIDFGESTHLKIGQKVIAIGNPFGLDRTMTTGIVSGLGRPIQSSQNTIIRDMIQTDTAINPGNSGGPLLDMSGKIVGINTMIYSNSGDSAGISFAVPANTAKRVAAELIQNGKVRRGTIDASFVQLNSSIANYAKLAVNSGLLVQQVVPNGNAEKAGIKGGTQAVRYGSARNSQVIYLGGDVITAIDGIAVSSLAGYYAALESKKPGEEVSVAVLRGRKTEVIEVVLTE